MHMLTSINNLLAHIKEVQEDTIQMSQDSMMMLGDFLEKNNIEVDETAAKALQYQDIISQQLSATIDAIDSVEQSIEVFENAYHSDEKLVNDSMEKLRAKLAIAIEKAKDRKDAFSGKLGHDNEDEIEFF